MTDDKQNNQTTTGEDANDSKDSSTNTPATEPEKIKDQPKAEDKPTEATDPQTKDTPTNEETTAPETNAVEAEANEQEAEAKPDVLEETAEEAEMEAEEIPFQDIKSGMTVRVHEKIIDTNPKGEERQRIQVFQGMIIGTRGAGNQRTMTVRKVNKGLGVEKIFPLSSPNVTKIEVLKKARVRRAKLGFLRGRYKKRLRETKVAEEK